MKTNLTLCVLAAAGILVTACAAETSTTGEATQQVYQTGSNIPRHAPAGSSEGQADRDAIGRAVTDPMRTQPMPPPPGGAR